MSPLTTPTRSTATPPSEQVRSVDQDLGPEGRVLVRPSGTEPVVRVMVECNDADTATITADRLVELVKHATGRA